MAHGTSYTPPSPTEPGKGWILDLFGLPMTVGITTSTSTVGPTKTFEERYSAPSDSDAVIPYADSLAALLDLDLADRTEAGGAMDPAQPGRR